MQNPTEQAEAEASIPTDETVSNGPNLNRTVTVRRKAAKRSERWYQHLTAPLSMPARKKPRVEEPLPTTTTDEAARKTVSPDISVGLPPAAADNDDTNANAEPVTDTQPNAGATRATGRWTSEEVAKLTSAVTDTCKKKWGKEYMIDWVAVAARVPGRTNIQCWSRWKDVVDPKMALTSRRAGKWTADEDIKLKYSVQMHGGKDWATIAALVPGRTKSQCWSRWHDALDPTIDRSNGRTGAWTADEHLKLKYSVQMHGGKDWGAIAALVPGRTKNQCHDRWRHALDPSIALTAKRTGTWTVDEDIKLKAAVQTHGGKDWAAIGTMVPGRTKNQCYMRWHKALDPSITLMGGRTGQWTEDEDLKLRNSVQMHGGEDWAAIAALVPRRTNTQCYTRWHNALDPSIALTAGRTGKWTEDEDKKLKNSVQMHGGKDWAAIAALVPGRTKLQCHDRWYTILDPNMALTAKRTCSWTEDEDLKLKNTVKTHGGKDWGAIAALVLGRTKSQCYGRWHDVLGPSIKRAKGRTGTWTEDEDIKLKNSVQMHGGKDWAAIATMVPGRTKKQCTRRWHDILNHSIDRATARMGKWTGDEDNKLRHAVQTSGGKDWAAIATMVPGRTKKQCHDRWVVWKKRVGPNRSAAHGTLKQAPDLGKDPHSP
jgi:hypothetical protein